MMKINTKTCGYMCIQWNIYNIIEFTYIHKILSNDYNIFLPFVKTNNLSNTYGTKIIIKNINLVHSYTTQNLTLVKWVCCVCNFKNDSGNVNLKLKLALSGTKA